MGQSSEQHIQQQEFIDVRIPIEYYHNNISKEDKLAMEVRKIHVSGWEEEYKKNEKWKAADKLTRYKEYKNRLKIEFEIRNKTK